MVREIVALILADRMRALVRLQFRHRRQTRIRVRLLLLVRLRLDRRRRRQLRPRRLGRGLRLCRSSPRRRPVGVQRLRLIIIKITLLRRRKQ
jgi:hypothetical protein